MKARVGMLAVGARFDTCLTGRAGVVRAQSDDETTVALDGEPLVRKLHPNVLVRVEAVH
jgi:hypothetical protein